MDGSNSVKKVATNTIMLYVMTIGKHILPLLTLPYLTRILTPHYYGIVTYMTSTMTYFQVLIDFGFIYSATREVSLHREDKNELGKIICSVILSKLLLGVLGMFILGIMILFVPIMHENVMLSFLYYLSILVTTLLPDFLYRGLERMQIVSIRFILARLVSTILTFLLIKSPKDIMLVPVLTICGNIVAVIFSFYHLYRKEKIYLRKCNGKRIIKTIKESSVFFMTTFATTAFGATTTFFMGIKNLHAEEIAYWNLAYQGICSIQTLYEPITSSLYPHMVKEKDIRLVKRMFCFFIPFVLIGTILCYCLSETIIAILGGENYIEAVHIFRVLLPMLIFSFPAQLYGFPVLAPIKREKGVTVSTMIAALFHVSGLVGLMLVNKFEIVNIAFLRSCTDAVLLICRVIIYRKFRREYIS